MRMKNKMKEIILLKMFCCCCSSHGYAIFRFIYACSSHTLNAIASNAVNLLLKLFRLRFSVELHALSLSTIALTQTHCQNMTIVHNQRSARYVSLHLFF